MIDFPYKDWPSVQPFPFNAARKIFTGPTSLEELVTLRYYRRPDAGLAAVAVFGPRSEGAPGQVHGGMILTVLDEALGAAAWTAGHPVLTVRLETDFRHSVPMNAELYVETRLISVRHRIVQVEGSLFGPDGKLYAAAKGRFMELNEEARRRVLGRP